MGKRADEYLYSVHDYVPSLDSPEAVEFECELARDAQQCRDELVARESSPQRWKDWTVDLNIGLVDGASDKLWPRASLDFQILADRLIVQLIEDEHIHIDDLFTEEIGSALCWQIEQRVTAHLANGNT